MKKIFPLLLFILAACTIFPSPSDRTTLPSTPHIIPGSTKPIPIGPEFPRLGIWWPDLYKQSLEKAARYDWAILGEWQTDFLGPLSELNPRMRLLISTSASEVEFNPNDPSVNAYLQAIPPEWYLTQVGTNLRESVDASQNLISVNAVRAGDIDLFIARRYCSDRWRECLYRKCEYCSTYADSSPRLYSPSFSACSRDTYCSAYFFLAQLMAAQRQHPRTHRYR